MPYMIKPLAGTRRDPNARRRHLRPEAVRRAFSRLRIGARALKKGRGITISDAVYEQHKEQINKLAEAGIVSLLLLGNKEPVREQLHAPAPMPPEAPPAPEAKEEEPARGVVEIDMNASDDSAIVIEAPSAEADTAPPVEAMSVEEPVEEPKAAKKATTKKRSTRKKSAKK
jgi:hypothetical protein